MTISRDKKVHFVCGYLAGWTGGWLAYVFMGSLMVPASILFALLFGILKELYDLKVKKTVFNWNDVFATVVGGAASALVWFGITFLI